MNRFSMLASARFALALALVVAAFSGTASAVDVPEIDPGSISGAVALLSGGVMLLTNRRRSK